MAALVPVHEHVRGAPRRPGPAAAGRGRRSAGWRSIERRRRSPAVRPTPRSSARPRGCAASSRLPGDKSISHRALMLATLAAGESRIDGRGRRRRRPLDGGDRARALGARRSSGLADDGPARRLPGRLARRRRAPRARRRPRLRQLRDEPAAVRRDPRRAAAYARPRRRRFVARPSGGSYHRTAALDGRGAPRRAERLPSAADRGRSHPAPGDRRVDDRSRAPRSSRRSCWRGCGRTAGRRSARRSRRAITRSGCCGRGACRSSEAPTVGRRGGDQSRRRGDGAGGRRAGSGRRLGGRVLAGRRRDPPGRRARPCAASASTRPGGRSSTSCGAMGAEIEERRRRRGGADADEASASRCADLVVRSSALQAIDARPADVAAAIDEIPILCLAAAQARGHDDDPRRRRAAPQGVRPDRRDRRRPRARSARGSSVDGDDLRDPRRRPARGAATDSLDDHRLAMTFAIAGLIAAAGRPSMRPGQRRDLVSRLLRRSREGRSMTKRVVLIGHPVAHSLSGAMQQAAFDDAGHRRDLRALGPGADRRWPTRSPSCAATTSSARTSRSRTRSGSSRSSTG